MDDLTFGSCCMNCRLGCHDVCDGHAAWLSTDSCGCDCDRAKVRQARQEADRG